MKKEHPHRYPEVFTLLNGDIEPRCQEIEVASTFQIPHFQIIGLPGPEVAEAKDRIRSAIESSDLEFPKRKVMLNLSPAAIRKEGTGLDLAMAVAVVIESWRIDKKRKKLVYPRIFAWGELGLDGRVKAVGSPARAIASAILGKADLILIADADEMTFRRIAHDLFDAALVPSIQGIGHLRDISDILQRVPSSETALNFPPSPVPPRSSLLPIPRQLGDILQIAAAGAHHFLLLGPKGVGKSLALDWFLALQPALGRDTIRTRRFLTELSGREDELPYRRVSTQAKPSALLGSYSRGHLRPGEYSLAHGGVLLADEFPEWPRDTRESLREPLERRKVTLTRVDGSVELPSDFTFAGNGNLCPCGGVKDAATEVHLSPCRCLPGDRAKYIAKMSGPILDRLDLVIHFTPTEESASSSLEFSKLSRDTSQARERLKRAYGVLPGKLSPSDLEELLISYPILRSHLDANPFRSFRDRHKTLRIALTIGALRERELPDAGHFQEARALRMQSQLH